MEGRPFTGRAGFIRMGRADFAGLPREREAGEELNYVPEGEAVRFHRGITERGVDYTTMLQLVPGEFQVVLNDEHVAWAWAPLDYPPQPVHPGIAEMLLHVKQASDDLVAHIPDSKLRGSKEWVLMVRAKDKSGKEYEAKTALTIK